MPSDWRAPSGWLSPDWDAPEIGALMSTREGGISLPPFDTFNLGIAVGDDPSAVAENRRRFAVATGARPVYLRQVHGTRVVRLTAHDLSRPPPEADASLTTERGVACTVQVADCMPVLLAAPGASGVAAAHAGWRGLAGGVLQRTVEALCQASGCRPSDLRAWLGPCIGPRRFEVGPDVLAGFKVDPDDADPKHFAASAPGKWLAHLPAIAHDRLTALGVRMVHGGTACTVEDASSFFSYRRDRVTGRHAAAVWLRG